MPKYIRVTRSDTSGSYIQPVKEIAEMIKGEFNGIEYYDVGTSLTLTVVEMTEEEYKNLNEFTGW